MKVAEAMPDVEVWPRAAGQDIFIYVYFQTDAGSYAYRYRFTNGPQGLQEHAAHDQRNGIAAGLTRAAVEALF
jgi:hypothetical protein